MKPHFDSPIWRPYTQQKTAAPALRIERAEGSYLFTKCGQKIFDGISSWWLITHGHCHPEIVAAIQKQAAKLDQVTFANFTHEPAEELSEILIKLMPPGITRVFFSDNGSTAVEVALKMAMQACAQNGNPAKQKFLSFESAYHGDTVGAMSVSGESPFNKPYRKTLFEVLRAKHPTSSKASSKEYLQDFERLIEVHHRTLAGVIVEPLIQGAGGMIVWPDEAVKRIAELCREYGVYLIFDEVMTGFGRTGKLFAMDRLGVVPDLVCLSKGLTGGTLPLAVTLVREEIYQTFLATAKERMFFHGHSFTGNPISCAAAVASLKIFQRPATIRRIERIEAMHVKNIESARRRISHLDIRQCGTMAAIEIDGPAKGYLGDFAGTFTLWALNNDLFVRPLGNVVYLLPPFCSSDEDIDLAWEILTLGILKNAHV